MIGAVSQFAQIGPILLFLLKCKCVSCFNSVWAKKLKKYSIPDRAIIYGLFLVGLLAGCCMALFWDKTMFLFGQTRSVAFFSCVFCLAILDCTCTIAFLTYIGNFKGNYITGLYIGEGISSLLPSLFALMQGIGDGLHGLQANCQKNSTLVDNNIISFSVKQPRFSISVYFWLLLGTLVVSFFAFLMLEFWPSFQKEKLNRIKKLSRELKEFKNYQEIDFSDEKTAQSLINNQNLVEFDYSSKQEKSLDKFLLLVAITLVSFILYGFIPGLSSYSALPYGNDIMHLCVTLGIFSKLF